MIPTFFIALIFFMSPGPEQLTVTWQNKPHDTLLITYAGDYSQVEECISTGFVFEQRFLMRTCDDSDSWIGDCKRTRRKVHRILMDPIRKEYTVITDLHGDIPGPVTNSFKNFTRALEYFKVARDIPLQLLQRDEYEKTDLSVRVVSSCKGEYSETLAQLSYLFTLGIIDLGGDDTGWFDFDLNKSAEQKD